MTPALYDKRPSPPAAVKARLPHPEEAASPVTQASLG
jgi:hypothetical protein